MTFFLSGLYLLIAFFGIKLTNLPLLGRGYTVELYPQLYWLFLS